MNASYRNRNVVTDLRARKAGAGIVAVCMSGALVAGGVAPVSVAYADEGAAAAKSQVVYVKSATDGSQRGVYVVNRFENAKGVSVTDKGSYGWVANLSDSQQLSKTDPVFESDSDSFSYQGNLAGSTATPWNIEAAYYLNGEKLSAGEIAGKSGHVKIEVAIAPNDACAGPYADNYLVQATASLDSESSRNVESETGTVAQSVGNTQTTFMVLPGKSAVCTVEADIEDFSFDGWQIVGVPLSMAIDVDDSQFASATESLKDLESATQKLADGAGQVKSGSTTLGSALDSLAGMNSSLTEGTTAYASAIEALSSGAQQLDMAVSASLLPGMRQLASGSTEYQNALSAQAASFAAQASAIDVDSAQAACQSTATAASKALAQTYATAFAQAYAPAFAQAYAAATASGLDEQAAMQQASAQAAQSAAEQASAAAAASGDVAAAQAQATQATQTLAQAVASKAGNQAASEALSGAASSYEPLAQGIAFAADENSSTGVAALSQATGQLSTGLSQATSAYVQLQQGVAQYAQGVGTLASQYGTLQSGTSTLSSGAETLAAQTDGIDEKALNQVKDQLSEYLNPTFQQQDFVSGETDNIDTVQFVYKTGEVKAADAVASATDESSDDEPQSFLEKLAALFGL